MMRTFSVNTWPRPHRTSFPSDEECVVISAEPVETKNEDGSTSVSMGFPVLMVSGWVADPEKFAREVAELLGKDEKT